MRLNRTVLVPAILVETDAILVRHVYGDPSHLTTVIFDGSISLLGAAMTVESDWGALGVLTNSCFQMSALWLSPAIIGRS